MKKALLAAVFALPLVVPVGATAQQDNSIEVMHYFTSGGEAAAINELRQAFEARGGHWVDTPVAGGGGEAHDQALKARVLAGNPPGAAMPKLMDAQTWAQGGYLVDLEDVAKAEHWDEVYPEAIRQAAKTNGRWSAVPIDLLRSDMMWVNPTVLAKVGAQVPTTWDEFNAVADKLKAAGITPLAHGGQNWQDTLLFEYVLLGIGGPDFYRKTLVEGDPEALKSDTMLKVFEQFRKLRGYVDENFSGRDWNLATGMLMKGEAAFQMMGDWTKGEVTAAKLTPGKDILCVPTPRSQPNSFLWISNSMSFFAADKNNPKPTDAQRLLATVLSDGPTEVAYALRKGGGIARMNVDTSAFDECAKFEVQTAASANSAGALLPDLVGGMTPLAGLRGAIYDAVTNFFNSDMSAEEGVQQLSDAIELSR